MATISGIDVLELVSGGASNPRVLAGTADPSAGGGVAAAEGSWYLRFVATAGELWYKTAAANTAWVSVMVVGTATHTTGVQSRGVGIGAVVGNAKGSGASDLQALRTAVTQVASGLRAFAANRENTASGDDSAAMGYFNTASGTKSFAQGTGNTASGDSSVAHGDSSQALGTTAIAMGLLSQAIGGAVALGTLCNASATASMASGESAAASRVGQAARASGQFNTAGDAQGSSVHLRRQTTDATVTELTLTGGAPAAGTRFVLEDNKAYTCYLQVVGRRSGADQVGIYVFEFGASRAAGVATTRVLGNVKTVIFEDAAAWDANVIADTTNGSIQVTVVGVAAQTINWSATCWFSEVGV